ncbi:MAG TPA: hypothetical protein VFD82_17125 [Planctomycetota bacterium]|nr:hypothetical protein [Planctomycetota bacterium]
MNSERFSSWLFLLVLLFALRSEDLPAQTTCSNLGSIPVAATLEAGPIPLGCSGAANWPCWHLFTPAHRAPAPHAGFDPGNATPRPRVIVVYRCTGFLLLPVVPVHIRTMGYVIDQPEIACAG